MKIQTTITKEEHDNTVKSIMVDPCTHIQCGSLDCEKCPLRAKVEALREEQENFIRVLNEFEVENNE